MTPRRAALVCHPDTLSPWERHVEATVSRREDGKLALSFALWGDLGTLLIPEAGPQRRGDKLWQHTCFELFVGAKDEPAYCEFNFAPSREWAAYSFRRYREGLPLPAEDLLDEIHVNSGKEIIRLDAIIHLDLLPIPARAPLRIALSTVLEEQDGTLCYWALRHAPGKPDFHHDEAFALILDR